MCLSKTFITRREAREWKNTPSIAKEDITVSKRFKIYYIDGKELLMSPYKNYRYHRGWHYYNTGKCFSGRIVRDLYRWTVEIESGLHAYLTYSSWRDEIKCIIPKGSKYYINGLNTEIVADNLIIPYE